MALDLSALEEKQSTPATAEAAKPSGKPLDISLTDIEEDPDQPRKEFTPEAMQEMTDSIRARGVKTPVSVRTHPSKPGKWMLNYGARRYRGSLASGRATIPAFIDEAHDSYDQVIENIQRDDLKPMELALFIQKRLDAGEQKNTIAKNLGKAAAVITEHLSLINPPACIEDAYSTGKCTSPKTLYELRGLHAKFPEQVEAWCVDVADITRKTVAELADELKGKKKPAAPTGDEQSDGDKQPGDSDTAKSGNEQMPGSTGEGQGQSAEGAENKPKPGKTKAGEGADGEGSDDGEAGRDTGELTSWPKGRAVSDPDRMNKPLMLVEFDGRSAAILLNRRPTTPGLIHIRFEDGGGDKEVDAGACKINLLTEAEK